MKKILVYVLMSFCCLPIGNSQNEVATSLQKADSLIEENQLSLARQLLQSINDRNILADTQYLEIADAYHNLGRNYYDENDYKDALNVYTESLKIRNSYLPKNDLKIIISNYMLGVCHRCLGAYKTALKFFRIADDKMESNPEKEDNLNIIALIYTGIIDITEESGDYETSLNYCRKTIRLWQSINNRDKLPDIYNRIGNNYEGLENYESAIKAYENGLKIANSLPDRNQAEIADINNNLGLVYKELEEYKKAIQYFKVSLTINSQEARVTDIADNLENLGTVYKRQAQYRKALSYTLQSKATLEEEYQTIHHPNIAKSYDNLADIYAEQGKIDQAIKAYQQGLFCLIPNFAPTPITNNPNSSTHVIQDKLTALTLLSSKAKTFQALAKTENQPEQLINALYTYETLDTLITQIRQSYQATGSKYHLIDKTTPIYQQAIEVASRLYELTKEEKYWEQGYYFAAKNKAIILLEGLQDEKAKRYSGISTEALEKEQNLKKAVYELEGELYKAQGENNDSLVQIHQNDLFEKRTAFRGLIQQFEKDNVEYYKLKYAFQNPLTKDSIQAKLADDQLFIEYALSEGHLFTFVISNNEKKYYSQPLPENFQDTCLVYKQMLNDGLEVNKKDLLQLSHYLYQTLLEKPLLDFTKKDAVRRLIIIPDNSLLLISFDALLTKPKSDFSGTVPYLIYDYALSIAYSNQLIFDSAKNKRVTQAIEDYVGFGLEYDNYTLENFNKLIKEKTDTITNSRAFGRLEYSDDEVIEGAELLNGQKWINQAATLENFKENGTKGKILHFSGHGIVNEINPLNSALVFTRKGKEDFLFRASDLYHTPLVAKLAILSACNSGTGRIQKGEGIRSLARIFEYAGCPSLIASMWDANDKTTKEIILPFLAELKKGIPKDIALQKAKIKYLTGKHPEGTNPFYWSHLALIGDCSPIELSEKNWFNWKWGLVGTLVVLFFLFNPISRQ